MKSSFILHFSQRQAFESMTDAEAGRCIKRVFQYAETGSHDECADDPAVRFSLLFITERLDQDAAAYSERCRKNKESGEKGGRPAKNRTVISETERLFQKPNGYFHNPTDSDIDSVSDSDTQEKDNTGPPDGGSVSEGKSEGKRFIPPTVSQVAEYVLSLKSTVDPEAFVAFYESKGWMIGKNKVEDWKACARTWEANDKKRGVVKPAIDSSWIVYRDWAVRYLERRRAMHPGDTPETTQEMVDAGAKWLGEWICPDGFSEAQIKAGIVWLLEKPSRCQYVKHLGDLGVYAPGAGGNLGTWAANGAMGMDMPADPFNPGQMTGGTPDDIA